MEQSILVIKVDGIWKVNNWAFLFRDLDNIYSELILLEHFSIKIQRGKSNLEVIGIPPLNISDDWQVDYTKEEKEKKEKIARKQFENLRTNIEFFFKYYSSHIWLDKLPTNSKDEFRYDIELSKLNRKYDYESDHQITGMWSGFTKKNPTVQKIRFSSPGWIELLGSLNPFKLIADGVRDWRKENTEREKNKNQLEISSAQLNLEREKLNLNDSIEHKKLQIEEEKLRSNERIEITKVKAEIVKYLLETSYPLKENIDTKLYSDVLNKVSEDVEEKLIELSKNELITDIKIINPKKKKQRKKGESK